MPSYKKARPLCPRCPLRGMRPPKDVPRPTGYVTQAVTRMGSLQRPIPVHAAELCCPVCGHRWLSTHPAIRKPHAPIDCEHCAWNFGT